MANEIIEYSCGKCFCTSLEEHKKNRQDDTCRCECQDKRLEDDDVTKLETITVVGERNPSRPEIIDLRRPESPVIPNYPLPLSPQADWYDNIWIAINQLPKNTQKLIDKIGRKKVANTLFNPNKIEIVVVAKW